MDDYVANTFYPFFFGSFVRENLLSMLSRIQFAEDIFQDEHDTKLHGKLFFSPLTLSGGAESAYR